MPELTAEQADELADATLRLKIAVGSFRNCFFNTLTPEQRDGLRSLTICLGDEVDHLTAVAIQLTLVDLRGTLTSLGEVTTGVNQAVAHLTNVGKVVTVATSLVDLGAAIASANPGAVLSAVQNAVTTIKS